MARIYSGTCKEINPDFNAPTSWALYLWRYVCFLGFLNLLKGKIFSSLLKHRVVTCIVGWSQIRVNVIYLDYARPKGEFNVYAFYILKEVTKTRK